MKPETRKQEIIQTAAKLFKEKGYSAVTMRDIASAMGIKASSLYNHINSKQDILKDIIISIAEEFTNGMSVIKSSNVSAVQKLKQIITLHVEITFNNTHGMASLNNDWMHLETQLDYYLELRRNYENDFRDIITSGIASHEIATKNPDTILFSILTTLRSLYLWIPKKNDFDSQKFKSDLSSILIYGLK